MSSYKDKQLAELTESLYYGGISRREFLKAASMLVGAVSASSLLAACAPAAPSGADRIRLGLMATISGFGSIHAPPVLNCALMALDEINKAGGVLGQQVDLLIEDNHTDVDIAVQKGLRLVEEKNVAAFVDFGFSNSRFAVAEEVALAKKAMMISSIFYEGGICNRYFFNIASLPNQGIDPFVPWLMEERGAGTFYGIGSAYAWGIGSIDAVERAVAANDAEFLGREEAPLGTTDWSAIIQRLDSAGPDVSFVFVAGNDLVTFLKQFFDFGLNEKVQLAYTFFQEEVTPTIAEEYRAGHLSTNTWFKSYDTPASNAFKDSFAAYAGADTLITNFGEMTYDAVYMWAKAVEEAGTIETEKVIDAFENLTFDAPQGTIEVDAVGHNATVRALIGESTTDPNNFEIVADLGMIPPEPPEACDANSVA